MFRTSLKYRLMFLGFVFSAIPLLVMVSINFFQNVKTSKMVTKATTEAANTDLEHIVQGVYATCNAVQEQIQAEVNRGLRVGGDILSQKGKVSLGNDAVSWQATNQYSKKMHPISLPKLLVGDEWIGKTNQVSEPSIIVDKVKSLVGGTCTLFQRMDEAGSMLRVATNVIKKDGKRATGTYIPAINPDGQPNPVVSEVLAGETFRGRAFVVDRWYITAYEPLYDAANKIVGMLYVGFPQESVTSLRTAIMSTKVGRAGSLTVIDSLGNFVISKGGQHDGLNIGDISPVRELIDEALQIAEDSVGHKRYNWLAPWNSAESETVAKFIYFKPWDWIILAGMPADEFEAVGHQFNEINRRNAALQVVVVLSILVVVVTVLYFVAGGIVRPLAKGVNFAKAMASGDFTNTIDVQQRDEFGVLAQALNDMGHNLRQMLQKVAASTQMVTTSSTELSNISNQLADGAQQSTERSDTVSRATGEMTENLAGVAAASSQATANMQMVASATEEMSATIREIAGSTEQGRRITEKAVTEAQSVTQKVSELGRATEAVGNITDTIAEISEQTNLLALNATIEAARAGEAGKGFAVVANEIKELARETAAATQEINQKISSIQTTTSGTVTEIEQIVTVIQEISSIVAEVSQRIDEQATATVEIASNVNQASQGIQEVDENVSHGSQVAEAIADDIVEVTGTSQEVSQSSSRVNESAQNLTALAESLREKLAQFRV